MRKTLDFLKCYWFGLLMSLILLIGFLFFLLVLISPHNDLQKRGFVPCTDALAQNLLSCPKENKYTCSIKHILAHSWCHIEVIGEGFSFWWQGKQATPWSNYIYEPQTSTITDPNDDFYADYEAQGISPAWDMQQIIKMHENLEKQNALQSQIKEDKKDEKTK